MDTLPPRPHLQALQEPHQGLPVLSLSGVDAEDAPSEHLESPLDSPELLSPAGAPAAYQAQVCQVLGRACQLQHTHRLSRSSLGPSQQQGQDHGEPSAQASAGQRRRFASQSQLSLPLERADKSWPASPGQVLGDQSRSREAPRGGLHQDDLRTLQRQQHQRQPQISALKLISIHSHSSLPLERSDHPWLLPDTPSDHQPQPIHPYGQPPPPNLLDARLMGYSSRLSLPPESSSYPWSPMGKPSPCPSLPCEREGQQWPTQGDIMVPDMGTSILHSEPGTSPALSEGGTGMDGAQGVYHVPGSPGPGEQSPSAHTSGSKIESYRGFFGQQTPPAEKPHQAWSPLGRLAVHQGSQSMPCEREHQQWTPQGTAVVHYRPPLAILGGDDNSLDASSTPGDRMQGTVGEPTPGRLLMDPLQQVQDPEMSRVVDPQEKRPPFSPAPPPGQSKSSLRSRLRSKLLVDVPMAQRLGQRHSSALPSDDSPTAVPLASDLQSSVASPSLQPGGMRAPRLAEAGLGPVGSGSFGELSTLALHFQLPKTVIPPGLPRSPKASGTPTRSPLHLSPRPSPPTSPLGSHDWSGLVPAPATQVAPAMPSRDYASLSVEIPSPIPRSPRIASSSAAGSAGTEIGYGVHQALASLQPAGGEALGLDMHAGPTSVRTPLRPTKPVKEPRFRQLSRRASDASEYSNSLHGAPLLLDTSSPQPRARQGSRIPVSGPPRLTADASQASRRSGLQPGLLAQELKGEKGATLSTSTPSSPSKPLRRTVGAGLSRLSSCASQDSTLAEGISEQRIAQDGEEEKEENDGSGSADEDNDPPTPPLTRSPKAQRGKRPAGLRFPARNSSDPGCESGEQTDHSSDPSARSQAPSSEGHTPGTPSPELPNQQRHPPPLQRLARLTSDAAVQYRAVKSSEPHLPEGGVAGFASPSAYRAAQKVHVASVSPVSLSPSSSGGIERWGSGSTLSRLGERTGSVGWGDLESLLLGARARAEAGLQARQRRGLYPGSFKEGSSSPSVALPSAMAAPSSDPHKPIARTASEVGGAGMRTTGSLRGSKGPSTCAAGASSAALSPRHLGPSRFFRSTSEESGDGLEGRDDGPDNPAKEEEGGKEKDKERKERRVRGVRREAGSKEREEGKEKDVRDKRENGAEQKAGIRRAPGALQRIIANETKKSSRAAEDQPNPALGTSRGSSNSSQAQDDISGRRRDVSQEGATSSGSMQSPLHAWRHMAQVGVKSSEAWASLSYLRKPKGGIAAQEKTEKDGDRPGVPLSLPVEGGRDSGAKAVAAAALRARVRAFRAKAASATSKDLNVAAHAIGHLASPEPQRPKSFREGEPLVGYEMPKGQDMAKLLQAGAKGPGKGPLDPSQGQDPKPRLRRQIHSGDFAKMNAVGHETEGRRAKGMRNTSRSSFDFGPELLLEGRSRANPTDHVLGREYRNFGEHYLLHKVELGSGQFGVIRKCKEIATGNIYACKTIHKKIIQCFEDAEDIRREVACLSMLRGHPTVVSLKSAFEDSEDVHMVMDLCRGGDLFDRIRTKGHLAEADGARLCRALVEALLHCHCMGIMHRDVKPENILMVSENSDSDIKLVDFGVACFVQPGTNATEETGTPEYMAPEILKGSYGPQADIWSAGIVLYIVVSGVLPFWASDRQSLNDSILNKRPSFKSQRWEKVSPECRDLVVRMLTKDPNQRISATEILAHPWIQRFTD